MKNKEDKTSWEDRLLDLLDELVDQAYADESGTTGSFRNSYINTKHWSNIKDFIREELKAGKIKILKDLDDKVGYSWNGGDVSEEIDEMIKKLESLD